MKKFYNSYNLSHESFLKLSLKEDFIDNHIVQKFGQNEVTMLSGQTYPLDKATGTVGEFLLIGDRIDEGNISYKQISYPLIPDNISQIVLLSKLPYDLFVKFVIDQRIRGKDLISMCVANEKINEMCNYRNEELFRRLLKLDYDFQAEENILRKKYIEFSKTRVWTFGRNNDGQLGLGDKENRNIPTLIEDFKDVKQISCGDKHTAFINDQVWTFGDNLNGQLGLDDEKDRYVPTLIKNFRDIKQISCGGVHTAFIDYSGQLWTFGDLKGYDKGVALGLGKYIILYNLKMPNLIKDFKDIKQISCGYNHTAFIDALGQVWTFGDNYYGQLGLWAKRYNIPNLIEGFKDIKQISCGYYHTAFIDALGQVWTFGSNRHGELGLGDIHDRRMPKLIKDFKDIKQISCGNNYTAFIDALGKIWTFGSNEHGQLGLGDRQQRNIPTLIKGFRDIEQISCGSNHTAFIDALGQVWTFGSNENGQLGLGDQEDRNIPTLIEGFKDIKQISCGNNYTAFVK